MSIKVEMKNDYLFVTGGKVTGTRVFSHDDHRIAMATAIAALGATGKVSIKDSHCISKSYPDFFNDLKKAGAIVQE